jgi:L-gulonolactone oxidase
MRKGAGLAWRNWAGNQQAVAATVARPASTDDVVAVVKAAADAGRTVKPVGSGHSFTAAAATDGVRIDLSDLAGLVTLSRASKLIKVKAGTQLSALNAELARHGLAMPNLGDIDVQTVSGALATGTHGTGKGYGCLSTFVTELELVTGTGEVLRCSREQNPDLFSAALVGVGAVGVVTEVTLRGVDAFVLHADERPTPLADVLAGLTDHVEGNDHFEFYWMPYTEKTLTKANNRYLRTTSRGGRLSAWVNDDLLENTALGAVVRLCRAVPAWTPALLRATASALLRPQLHRALRPCFHLSPAGQVRRDGVRAPSRGRARGVRRPATHHRSSADQGVVPGRGPLHRGRRHLAVTRQRSR